MSVHIRQAQISDFLAIAQLDAVVWPTTTVVADGEHTWRLWVEHALVLCAEQEQQIVGAVLAFSSMVDKRLFCLHKLFVRADRRHQQIGAQLLSAILQITDQQGVATFLTVDPNNHSALTLYQKLGYQEERFVKGFYQAHEDRYVLFRRVDGH